MLLQDCIKAENATGLTASGYDYFIKRMGRVPNVIELHSLNPSMLNQLINFFEVFEKSPNIDPVMRIYIRLLISKQGNCEYCIKLNSAILKHMEIKEEDIEASLKDINNLNLDQNRKDLVLLVVNMMYDNMPSSDKIDELKDLGWTEKDIYDATMVGVLQRGMIQAIKGFQIDIDF